MRNTGKNLKITANNITVSYTDEGPDNTPVIIFIHGFPFSKEMWNKQIDAFNEKFRVISYDIRGHGNSWTGTNDFSIELFVTDLLSLMDVLQIEKAAICGLSMGGYIALNAIENYPKRFNALILCDTQCLADSPEAKVKRINSIKVIWENGVEMFTDDSLKNFFASDSYLTKKEIIDEIREIMVNTTAKSIIKTLHALSNRKETCGKLSEIKVPVLILVGKEDKITPPETAQFMNENIKGSLMFVIEHSGHLSNIENPEQFNEHLKRFVEKNIGSNNTEVKNYNFY